MHALSPGSAVQRAAQPTCQCQWGPMLAASGGLDAPDSLAARWQAAHAKVAALLGAGADAEVAGSLRGRLPLPTLCDALLHGARDLPPPGSRLPCAAACLSPCLLTARARTYLGVAARPPPSARAVTEELVLPDPGILTDAGGAPRLLRLLRLLNLGAVAAEPAAAASGAVGPSLVVERLLKLAARHAGSARLRQTPCRAQLMWLLEELIAQQLRGACSLHPTTGGNLQKTQTGKHLSCCVAAQLPP